MSEFRTLSTRTLAFVPVLLSAMPSVAAMPEALPIAEDGSRLLLAQAEATHELPMGIQSGSEHTLVTTEGTVTHIEGGVQAGSNLFHRFDGFGIGVGETADFAVQETTQAVFGQVSGGGASYINGQLQVSGSDADLYLINPAGVLFGPDAQLNLGGSLAVTTADQVGFEGNWLDVAASDYEPDYTDLTGTPDAYRFTTDKPGAVVNQADLAVGEGQAIRLMGGDVANTGSLRAAAGEVTLTAVAGDKSGDSPTGSLVRLGADGALLSVEVAGDAVTEGAWNPLSVPALLTGSEGDLAADDLRINADGSVDLLVAEAEPVSLPAGAVAGSVLSAGDIDVSGQVGGDINLFGSAVEVIDGELTASGVLGGGTIQVGGGYQGKGELPTAERVLFGERAIGRADSLVAGDGGQIVLWSDGETRFDGQLSANASGVGAGGLIETSGLARLEVGQQASVSTQAQSGQLGTWLLDPDDLRVASTATGAAIVGGTNAPEGASEIDPTVLVTALNGTNVELQANNTITVDAIVDASGNAAGGNLTLTAPTLNLNERITLRSGSFLQPGSAGPTTVNVGSNGSVQNAVNAVATDGTVNLAAETYREASDILIQRNVTLRGQGRNLTNITGDDQHRVLTLSGVGGSDLSDDISVTIDSLAVRNGSSDYGAGIAVLDGVNLLLTNSLVENNRNSVSSPGVGGGLFFSRTGSSVIHNTTINNNFSKGTGGAVAVYGSHQLLIENSTLSNNRAGRNGGAIDSNSRNAAIEIVGGQITANVALNGGGISFDDTYISIDGTEFTDNVASDRGGAINAFDGTFDIRNSTFSENSVGFGFGGAIAVDGNVNIKNTQFSENEARTGAGGAIAFLGNGISNIDRSTFYKNYAVDSGGAIHFGIEHQLTVNNSTFYENATDGDGGAIYVGGNDLGAFTLYNSTVFDNSAGENGGGLVTITDAPVVIESSSIVNNSAGLLADGSFVMGKSGGGIQAKHGLIPVVRRTLIAGNTATADGQDVDGRFNPFGSSNNFVQTQDAATGDIYSNFPDGTDPLIGGLVDNGGGILTVALLKGSPAIDAGGSVAPGITDQRGFAIVGDRDIGAYEFQTAATRTVGDLLFVSGENQFSTVDTDYGALFQVRVTDTLGVALSGVQVDFTLPNSGAGGTINAGASTLITDVNGIASLAAVANQVAGSFALLAETADGLASASTTVTNRADVASKFALTGPTSGLIAGESVNFSVTALDRFDNVADSYSNTVSFAGSDARALLPASSVLTNGRGRFSATPITAGSQTLTVADAVNPSLVTDIGNILVVPAAAENLEVTAGNNQTATVNEMFPDALTVQVSDRFDNAIAGERVRFFPSGAGASALALSSEGSTDLLGQFSTALKANTVSGDFSVQAQAAGLSASFNRLRNLAGEASEFEIVGLPSATTAGESNAFTVTALDAFNNIADAYNNSVAFSSSDSQAEILGNRQLTSGTGDFLGEFRTAGRQSLTVADALDSGLSQTQRDIDVTAAAGEVLSILSGRGQTATVGDAFDQELTVRVSDRFGNPAAGEQVTFSVPVTGAGALLDSETVLTDAAGLATATLQANDVAGNYQAIASAVGISGLFDLENKADAIVVPDPITPVDLPDPVDVMPTDVTITDPPTVEPVSEHLFSDLMIPPEGTTEVDSSGDSLTEAKPQNQQSLLGRSDVFDEVAFAETERLLTEEYAKYWQSSVGKASTFDSVQQTLQQAETHHKAKSAVVYALFVPPGDRNYDDSYPSVLSQRLLRDETQRDRDQLLLVMVPPDGQPVQQLMDVSRSQIVRQAQLLGIEISMLEDEGYQPLARQLYSWLLAPIASDLQSHNIDNLMYVMDEGLRTLPLAAMMTGDRFAIEEYGISMLPSMGLLNADFDTAPSDQNVLTAGADRFEHLEALPAVPVELGLVANASISSRMLLNEAFSLEGLAKAQVDKSKTMVHLATHAAFNPGALERSYVQLWDEQLTLNEISALDLDGLEMLILSACATAMGSRDAELGFAGLAAATGVEASVGSLWNVSDVGTMALMAEFYEQLRRDPLRVTALQQAQLSLLRGETRLEDSKLITQKGKSLLPEGFAGKDSVTFSHPFFWSGFTLIGSPWW